MKNINILREKKHHVGWNYIEIRQIKTKNKDDLFL
jgi:hypothetical protein